MHSCVNDNYSARTLNPKDWRAFRELRLESLRECGDFLGGSYEKEKDMPVVAWREWCRETPEGCIIGLFNEAARRLVGLTIIDRSSFPDALFFGGTYITPEYRGRGAMRILSDARLQWSQGKALRAVLCVHGNNSRSIHLQDRHATYFETRRMGFSGQASSLWRWYQIDLAQARL